MEEDPFLPGGLLSILTNSGSGGGLPSFLLNLLPQFLGSKPYAARVLSGYLPDPSLFLDWYWLDLGTICAEIFRVLKEDVLAGDVIVATLCGATVVCWLNWPCRSAGVGGGGV